VTINENDKNTAKKKLSEMCEKLLANLVIEDYSVEIE
jgi:phosphoribosylformylglycinamidine synthase PurS subunit